MKNTTQLILANLFALVSVVFILIIANLLEIDLSFGSGAIFPKLLLILLPQTGFIYLLLNSIQFESKKTRN